MDHWQRIRAALKGEPVDRVPICLWRHWPVEDHSSQTLAAAMVRWQQEYDCDLVKHAPAGSYVVEDWDGQTAYLPDQDPGLGVRAVVRRAVTATSQWPALARLDVTQGHLGDQLAAVRLVAQALNGSLPILQTIFSPLNIAPKLAGERAFSDMRHDPKAFKQGLQILAETTACFALESIRAGAHGVFFVAPCDARLFSLAEYREFGEPYDRMILDAIRPEAEIVMVLVLGQEILFDLVSGYPADAINWPDRRGGPSLAEAQARFPGLVMGGIDEQRTLRKGPPMAIQAEIRDAIAQTKGRRYLVGPGSTPLIDTPAEHFRAARDAVERWGGGPGTS
jgi:uroporphyrinogen decarboxylase